MTDIKEKLRNPWFIYDEDEDKSEFHLYKEAADHIEKLEAVIEKLNKGLELYKRERDRFKHNKPEITGEYFLTGGHGNKDDNMLPEFVRICPAYGCAWEQVYEKTDKTISYEGL
jgi:hypothetical protein